MRLKNPLLLKTTLAVALLTTLAPVISAQEPTSSESKQEAMPYVNKSFGFELQIPAGWNYDQTGFFGPGESLGVLRGASPNGQASLQILVFRDIETSTFPDWIEYFSKQLGTISGIQRVQVLGISKSERPSAYVIVSAQIGIDHTRTLYYCVQFDQDMIWVLSLATTAKGLTLNPTDESDPEVPPEFKNLAKTLRVFYDPQLARRLAVALQHGKQYLARFQLRDDIRNLRIDESPRYFEIHVADKNIGYLTRQFSRASEPLQRPGTFSNAKEGLRVRERAYRFLEDGTVNFNKIDLFSSRDTETDLYELWQTRIPPPDSTETPLLVTRDQCIREGDTLFSTFTTNRDDALPEPRSPLKLNASFLGLAWVQLLPALLGPTPQAMLAFTIYDPETRTLITYAITALGEKPLAAFPNEKVYAYEIRTGFVEQPVIVHTDQYGNLLCFETGPFSLRLTDPETIERDFAARRAAANRRLQRERLKP